MQNNISHKTTLKQMGWIYSIAGAVILICISIAQMVPYSLHYVATPSIPMGFYIVDHRLNIGDLHRGDLVVFRYHMTEKTKSVSWFHEKMLFTKKIAGLAGDIMKYDQATRTFSVCQSPEHCENIGFVFENNAEGIELPQPDFSEKKIPDNHFFMFGYNDKGSYDSRYFGTVSGDQIVGTAQPFFVF